MPELTGTAIENNASAQVSGTRVGPLCVLAQPNDPEMMAPFGNGKPKSDFEKWFVNSPIVDAAGAPLVLYHGSQTPELLTSFTPGGIDPACQRGDAYGVAAYFTTSTLEASHFARDNGAVFPVFVRGEILDLDGVLTTAQSERLTKLASELLMPSDKARFECGRASRSYDNVEDARDFFDNQRKNWESFGDGMDRARPEAVAEGARFVVEYTDFDAAVTIRTGHDATTLFKAVGWDNLIAAGFDGLQMARGDASRWVVMHRPDGNIKSAIGNSGAFDASDPDITDRRAAAARAQDFLSGLEQKKLVPHA